jgi:hypothetical protein
VERFWPVGGIKRYEIVKERSCPGLGQNSAWGRIADWGGDINTNVFICV